METIFDKPLDKQVASNTQAIANLDADVATLKSNESLFKIVKYGTLIPQSIAANQHVHQTFDLGEELTFDKVRFILSPVSYADCAYISASAHFGQYQQSAQGQTKSRYLTVFVTNHYSSAQTAGCFWYVLYLI